MRRAAQAANTAGTDDRRRGGIHQMRKMLAIATFAALALGAGVALADEAKGKIQSIDQNMRTLTVDGQTFQWSDENSVGVKLGDLKEGDAVKVMYEANQKKIPDVMSISKEQ